MTQPTGGGDSIVFGASIDDKTLEFFNRFDANVERLAAMSEQGFNRVENAIHDVGPQIGVLSGLVSSLTTKVIEFGMQGLQAIKQFVQGSVQLTARADVLATVINKVGLQSGYTAEEIAAAEESVKSMGITTVSAREALVRMTRANIDWSEAATLARIAQDAAVVAGMNSSAAFERLVRGIQKQEPELLDELGITLRRTDAYNRMAEQLGKTAKQLSEVERQQAILNEIYRQAGAVTGSYEAAMENAGKQAQSLPRYIEELQLAIGRAFQPAYAAQIDFMTGQLKEMLQWFQENEEAVLNFANAFGKLSTSAFATLTELIDIIKDVPQLFLDVGNSVAYFWSMVFGASGERLEQIKEWGESWDNVATAGKQAMGLFIYSVAMFADVAITTFSIVFDGVKAIINTIISGFNVMKEVASLSIEDLIKGNFGDLEEAIAAVWDDNSIEGWAARGRDQLEGMTTHAEAFANQALLKWLRILGWVEDATEDVKEGVEDIGDAAEEVANKARKMGEALFAAAQKMKAANMESILDVQRQQVEELIRLSHQIEDIERNHLERLLQIEDDYKARHAQMLERQEKERQDLTEEHAKRRISIEKQRAERHIQIEQQFQDRLRDIQDQYEFDAREAGRARDAVRLRQLGRQREREIKEAEKTRDRAKRDADRDYEKRLAELDDWLEEEQQRLEEAHTKEQQELEDHFQAQLRQAEEAHRKRYEELQRSLDREKQLRDLAWHFQNTERARQFMKELTEHGIHLGLIEDITDMSLDNMLTLWDDYFQDLGDMIDDYIDVLEEQRDRMEDVGGRRTGGEGSRSHPGRGGNPRGSSPQGVIGQGGQVSELLNGIGNNVVTTNNSYFNTYNTPIVPPSSHAERREIVVRADMSGIDPHIQRVLINALVEVERNRVSSQGITRR